MTSGDISIDIYYFDDTTVDTDQDVTEFNV